MTISGLEDELRLAVGMPRLLYVKDPAPDLEPGLERMLDGIRPEGAASAARLMGTAAAVRDRFGLLPWPWVIQAEGRTIKRAAAVLPGDEYAAQLAVGRTLTIDNALTAALP
jgi:hypothetical protein